MTVLAMSKHVCRRMITSRSPPPQGGYSIRGERRVTTIGHVKKALAGILFLLVFGAFSNTVSPAFAGDDDRIIPADQWTVLTLASTGAWGTATDDFMGRALAFAIGNCRAMSGLAIGCGARSSATRAGWSVGVLCGNTPIIAARKQLAEAERAVADREIELRQVYLRDMPRCVRVVTVDPNGAIVEPYVQASGRRRIAPSGSVSRTAQGLRD
jgi:hypothetical protein